MDLRFQDLRQCYEMKADLPEPLSERQRCRAGARIYAELANILIMTNKRGKAIVPEWF